jgi:LL-diaminopimelate aminotransferase
MSSMNMFDLAERLKRLPFYLYPTIEAVTKEALREGKDLINLSTGDPEFATPRHIIDRMQEACSNPATHRYGRMAGYAPFLEAVAAWYKRRFGILLDSKNEVIDFLGSKEGIAFLPLAFLNPGDVALIPDPGYPTYRYAAAFANAKLCTFPIRPENNYEPDYDEIPKDVAREAKIIFLNYPNNPTGATVEKEFFERTVEFAEQNSIIVCHDAAYSEVAFEGYKAPSFLEVDGAKEVGVEFHTLSKTFCMTGWRLGFASGNPKIIRALLEAKRVTSAGHFTAIEMAGVEALSREPVELERNNRVFQKRRDFVVGELRRFGIDIQPPRASFYIWFRIPKEKSSLSFVRKMILETGVITFPGVGYGENGEGYVRIAIVQELSKIQEAFRRIEPYLKT